MDIAFDKNQNTAVLGGENLVFHCHYYNCTLQKAIEDGLGADALALQIDTAAQTIHAQLEAMTKGAKMSDVRELASSTFSGLGFGKLDLAKLGAGGGAVRITGSHYGLGWVSLYGPSAKPVCHFATGFAKGAFSIAFGVPLSKIVARETGCVACGADECAITIEVTP